MDETIREKDLDDLLWIFNAGEKSVSVKVAFCIISIYSLL